MVYSYGGGSYISYGCQLDGAGYRNISCRYCYRRKIDSKELRVFFQLQRTWIEAVRTRRGFIVPDALTNEEYVTILIKIGKRQIEFSEVHISKFQTSWIVGIDEPPFSRKVVESAEADNLEIVYWIEFSGEPGTVTTVKVWKPDETRTRMD